MDYKHSTKSNQQENIKGTIRATNLYTYREKTLRAGAWITPTPAKYRECTCMTIHGKAPTSSPISTENDESPKIFLKYSYRTKFPSKNNHTDPCLPANDQKMVCQTLVFIQQIKLIFSTQHDFKTCFDTKNAYLQFRLQ